MSILIDTSNARVVIGADDLLAIADVARERGLASTDATAPLHGEVVLRPDEHGAWRVELHRVHTDDTRESVIVHHGEVYDDESFRRRLAEIAEQRREAYARRRAARKRRVERRAAERAAARERQNDSAA